MKINAKEVKKSKAEALEKIKTFLNAPDINGQFDGREGGYYSKDKFIVTWLANWKGIPSEFGIDKCDSFYSDYSGNAAIYVTRSLFHEKQLKGFPSIERALIDIGLMLCPTKDKTAFFKKYAITYNERIKQKNKNIENEKNNDDAGNSTDVD